MSVSDRGTTMAELLDGIHEHMTAHPGNPIADRLMGYLDWYDPSMKCPRGGLREWLQGHDVVDTFQFKGEVDATGVFRPTSLWAPQGREVDTSTRMSGAYLDGSLVEYAGAQCVAYGVGWLAVYRPAWKSVTFYATAE